MITVYVSTPFAFGDLGSINAASNRILRHSARTISSTGFSMLFISPIFSVYNTDKNSKTFTEREYFMHSKVLLEACQGVVALISSKEEWAYSPVITEEIGYAYYLKKEVAYIEYEGLHSYTKDGSTG